MDAAAALLAGIGLIENSPAVIIGAMLIAMLFGPIIGIAMALAETDLRLLGRALKAGSWGHMRTCDRLLQPFQRGTSRSAARCSIELP
jgi:disulfide bond formation protein DsbB